MSRIDNLQPFSKNATIICDYTIIGRKEIYDNTIWIILKKDDFTKFLKRYYFSWNIF